MPDNEIPRAENWYPRGGPDREAVRKWYAYGGGPEESEQEPEAEYEPTGKRRLWVRALALCIIAALVMSGAVAAALRSAARLRMQMDEVSAAVAGEALPAEDAEVFEDYRDYFANYYSGTDDVGIPRAEVPSGMTLELAEAGERELSMQEIYEKVSPAVVGVTSWQNGDRMSWGTGVIFTEDGYLVTNTHVIQGSERATVAFPDGRELEALLVGEDSSSDIAVLKLEDGVYPCADFGDSRALRVGDLAVAIGNPLGEEYAGTMTNGIISAIDRSVESNGHSMNLLQTNAALNEGNSGGPLINAYGQVVGITNMKIMSVYYSTVEGIGFAIPSEMVKQVADQLLEHGIVLGTPTIGITAAPVTAEANALYDLPMGVYVASVDEGSDAGKKGLQVGDIILAVNGTEVSSVPDVNAIKEGFSVGDALTLTIYRDGETFDLEIVLVDRADIQS